MDIVDAQVHANVLGTEVTLAVAAQPRVLGRIGDQHRRRLDRVELDIVDGIAVDGH